MQMPHLHAAFTNKCLKLPVHERQQYLMHVLKLVSAGGSVEATVNLMPMSTGRFEVLLPLTVKHSQAPLGLVLIGSVQGLDVRCVHENEHTSSLLCLCTHTGRKIRDHMLSGS